MLHLHKDAEAVTDALAEWITEMVAKTLQVKERFTIALSGGSTPKLLYKKLSASPFKEKIDWIKMHFFWGDERYVPFTDDNNNAKMGYETLLNNVVVPVGQIHVMRTDIDPEFSAKEYEKILHTYFDESITTFDLVLLGMGEDGHTLSLFPGADIKQDLQDWVKAIFVEEQKMYRITLLPAVVNKAGSIVFLVTGSAKAKTLEQVLEGSYDPEKFPSQLIKPANGELHWFVDESAACEIKSAALK